MLFIMLAFTPFVTLLVESLLSLLSCFWLFALVLSLAVVSPTEAAAIVQTVLELLVSYDAPSDSGA